MRIQKKTKQPKLKLSATSIEEIEKAVRKTADKFECSKSFVISVALADFFGIKKQERYDS